MSNTVERIKRQAIEQNKVFEKQTFNTCLQSTQRTLKAQQYKNRQHNLKKKNLKSLNRHITKDDTWVVSRNTKTYSTLFLIRESQIKTT